MRKSPHSVAIIGGGPAGLRAAEAARLEGADVTLYEHKASVGRKFLVAGKSGLNLTNAAAPEVFSSKYSGQNLPEDLWNKYLRAFDNHALRAWARSLGVETFVASGGKVFPESKKAAPLLRRWVQHLKVLGVHFQVNHHWSGIEPKARAIELTFRTYPQRSEIVRRKHDAVVLALGGASWPQTGSDAAWVEILKRHGIPIQALEPANCGWECPWTEPTRIIAEGHPLHHLQLWAGEASAGGELIVTRYGFEGSPIYQLGPALRKMATPVLQIDFKPMFSIEHMVKKMESARRDFYKEARLRWKLSPAACAIIEQMHGQFNSAEKLARAAKACRIPLNGPRPIVEAISSSGGVAWAALDSNLMLKALPGVYCAGEMVDWEAPTGGFLLQGCFATGTAAGRAAGCAAAGNR